MLNFSVPEIFVIAELYKCSTPKSTACLRQTIADQRAAGRYTMITVYIWFTVYSEQTVNVLRYKSVF